MRAHSTPFEGISAPFRLFGPDGQGLHIRKELHCDIFEQGALLYSGRHAPALRRHARRGSCQSSDRWLSREGHFRSHPDNSLDPQRRAHRSRRKAGTLICRIAAAPLLAALFVTGYVGPLSTQDIPFQEMTEREIGAGRFQGQARLGSCGCPQTARISTDHKWCPGVRASWWFSMCHSRGLGVPLAMSPVDSRVFASG